MLNPNDLQKLQRYVAAGIPPVTESLLADAHIFVWDTNAPEDADFAIINRNGNFARAFQQGGEWTLYKHLGKAGLCLSPEGYERSGIKGSCLRECAQKMWLPARSEEKLTFVPKELTPPNSRRLLICRDQLFKLFGRGDSFVLELAGAQSPEFQGKPWECERAVEWCIARCRAADAPQSAEAILEQAALVHSVQQAEANLSEIWGSF